MNNEPNVFISIITMVLLVALIGVTAYVIYAGIKCFFKENSLEILKWILLGILLVNMTTCSFTCEISRAVHQMRVY